jgi:hypothetical protein
MLSRQVAVLEARLMLIAELIRAREAQLEAPRQQLSDAQRQQRRAAGQSRARSAPQDYLNRILERVRGKTRARQIETSILGCGIATE